MSKIFKRMSKANGVKVKIRKNTVSDDNTRKTITKPQSTRLNLSA